MITAMRKQFLTLLLLSLLATAYAQDMRTFNQNASRSNHTRLGFSFSPVYSTAVNGSSDSLLFRGSGAGFRFGGDYFIGRAGIGVTSGFSSSSPDNTIINNFLRKTGIPSDQLVVSKSNQQNIYLLLGPSVRFGDKVELYAHAQGGLFINNGGLVNIQQKGAQRAAYRNESTDKSIYPGFLTGLSVQYNTRSDIWSFGIGADYMNTKTEVNNYDMRRGGGIEPLRLSRNVTDIMAGITIRYNISSPRDHASGLATGRRVLPTVNKREMAPRDAVSGIATGKRSREAGSGIATGRRQYEPATYSTNEGCGTVTRKITRPDGTTEEMSFACISDAMAYDRPPAAASTMDTDGRSVSPAARQSLSNAAGERGVVSGRLSWASPGAAMAIVTNQTTTRGRSATMNSQSSSTRTTQNTSFGTMVRMSAREAGSGIATGRRSREAGSGIATGRRSREAGSGIATGKRSREAGSGIATGRRQYEPVFIEGQGDVCNPCMATVKSNPLYTGNTMSGTNPLNNQNKKEGVPRDADENCDGIAGMDVSLVDINSGAVVAKTRTEACGDFFFANAPAGEYIVRVSGVIGSTKGYDVSLQSKKDLLGSVMDTDDWIQLEIDDESTANQRIKTKSNIKNDRLAGGTGSVKPIRVATGDVDGDGRADVTAGNLRTSFAVLLGNSSSNDVMLPGVEIKLEKNSQLLQKAVADDLGEFELTALESGEYTMTVQQQVLLFDETLVTIKGAAPQNTMKAQNNSTVRSNRSELKSILIEADLDGDGEYESDITSSFYDDVVLNDKGDSNQPQQKAGISTSRSNIRTRGALQSVSNEIFTAPGTAILNNKEVAVQIVYKTRHETAKNSIGNIR